MRFGIKAGGLSPVMAYVPLSVSKVAVRYGAQPEEAEGDMVSGDLLLRPGRESATVVADSRNRTRRTMRPSR